MKTKAFTLLELIISISIMSILITYSMIFYNKNIQINNSTLNREIQKLDLLSFKIFIQKKIDSSKSIKVFNNELFFDKEKLFLKNKNIYFDKNILLQDINSFNIKRNNLLMINLCTNKICQDLTFLL